MSDNLSKGILIFKVLSWNPEQKQSYMETNSEFAVIGLNHVIKCMNVFSS